MTLSRAAGLLVFVLAASGAAVFGAGPARPAPGAGTPPAHRAQDENDKPLSSAEVCRAVTDKTRNGGLDGAGLLKHHEEGALPHSSARRRLVESARVVTEMSHRPSQDGGVEAAMNESSTGGVQPAAVPTYHVQFGGTGWGVSEGSGRAGALLPSQRAAVAEAYRLAAARRSALVVVHYFDKTVQQEYVFHGETKPIRRL